MGLRPRDKNPDVPGTSSGPPRCRAELDDGKCGKDAFHTISTSVEIMGKVVPVKFPVCDTHLEEVKNDSSKSA